MSYLDAMLGVPPAEPEPSKAEVPDYYRAVTDNLPEAVYTRDETGILLSVNRGVEEIFGYTAAELIGQSVTVLLAKPHPPLDEIRKWNRIDLMGRHKSGRKIPLSFSLGELVSGRARILTGIARDMSESHRIKRELEESERKFRLLVENVDDVVFQIDERGCWAFLNPAWMELTGFEVNESLGRMPAEFAHPEDRCILDELFAAVKARKHNHYKRELRWLSKSGQFRWIEFSAWTAVESLDGKEGLAGGLHDVTDRKQVEEDLRFAKEAAEKANRSKNEFLSRVSHELRTPLHAILGFAQLLDLEVLNGGQKATVGRILKAGRHLQNLINDIIDISRIESGRLAFELERLNPFDVLAAAVELVRPLLAEQNLELNIDKSIERSKVEVLADRQRLTQVFLNLLSNAVKYNRENGRVILEPPRVQAGYVRVSVTDTGAGIVKENVGRLFQPFDRLGAERTRIPGTGLGLALSKRIIESMRGRIGVHTERGIGSTFWVEMPVLEPVAMVPPAVCDITPEAVPHATVLYIEDEVTNVLLVEHILQQSAKVKFMTSMLGSTGIEMASLHTPALILLDLQLPDMTGTEVLRQLRGHPRTASIPVIVITGDGLESTEHQMFEAGAFAFLRKPLHVKTFMEIVEPILERNLKQNDGK